MNEIIVDKINLTLSNNRILKNVSVAIEKGKICGLIGRNGSGKTMLMKCIVGLVKPDDGEIYVSGKKIYYDTDFPNNIGVIIETPGFIPYYSGFKNLQCLAELRNIIGKVEIENAMQRVGLDPSLKRHVDKYSLGMRQRLGIAQVIMENPDILVLDEPFNGLDEEGVVSMRKLLLDLRAEGKTILMCSHSSEDISVLCDSIYKMVKGEIFEIKNN